MPAFAGTLVQADDAPPAPQKPRFGGVPVDTAAPAPRFQGAPVKTAANDPGLIGDLKNEVVEATTGAWDKLKTDWTKATGGEVVKPSGDFWKSQRQQWDRLVATGKTAADAFNLVMAPASGAVRALYSKPVEKLTGGLIKKEEAETALLGMGPKGGRAAVAAEAPAESAGARAAPKATEIPPEAEKPPGAPPPESATAAPPPASPTPAPAAPAPRFPGQPVEGPLSRPPALEKPREFEDQLFQLQNLKDADAIETTKRLDAVPAGVKPETWEKLYHFEEDPKGVQLTPEEKTLYGQHVAPLKAESEKLYQDLEGLGYPELAEHEAPPTAEDYTPRYPKGRTRSFGEVLEQWKQGVEARFGGAPGRSMRKTVDSQKSRRFYNAVNPETGEKTVVFVAPDQSVLAFDGSPKPQPWGSFKAGQKIAPGSKVMKDGQTFTLGNATTKEIEAVAQTRYSKNVLANRLDQTVKLRSALRNAQLIERMKDAPEWDRVAIKISDQAVPPKTGNREWRAPKLLQFRQYWMEPALADALDDFAKDMGSLDGLAGGLNKIGKVLNYVMFLNPKAHIDNVLNHMMVERGLVGNIIHAPQTFMNLLRATKSVLTADAEYIRTLRAGASLPYSRMLSGDLHNKLIEKLGGEVLENPLPWDTIARAAGYKDGITMIKRWGSVPQRILWAASDIMTQSRTMELKRRGVPLEKAFRETEKHMPNYRVPGQVLKQRWISQVFGNPAVGRFGRYQYGRLASYMRMLRDGFGPDRTVGERAQAFDQMAMLGAYLYVIYPMLDYAWQQVTGNPNAKTSRSGAASVPQAVLDVVNGDKDIGDLPQSVFTVGTPLEAPLELYSGRYRWSGQPIVRDADVRAGRFGQVARDIGSFGASNLSTLGQLADPSGRQSLGQVGLGALGVQSPSDEQVEARKFYKAKDAKTAARRAARNEARRDQ